MSIQPVSALEEFSIEETTNVVILKHLSQALIGVADTCDSELHAIYSSAACIQEIKSMKGLDYIDALAEFNLNIRIKHASTGNPMFLNDLAEGWVAELSRINRTE
jgi:hypothetical protein